MRLDSQGDDQKGIIISHWLWKIFNQKSGIEKNKIKNTDDNIKILIICKLELMKTKTKQIRELLD